MHKKLLISLVLIISLILPFTICYANDEMQKASNSVKNAVGGAENAIEGAAKNAGNAVKDAGNTLTNGANQMGNEIKDSANKAGNSIENGANNVKDAIDNNNDNSDYDATKTSGEGTFMGMTSTTWSWLILGIAAIVIIGIVWYYSVQLNHNKKNTDDE